MSNTPLRPVAIYCRISDDPDGRRLGVDRQEHSCRRLAAQRGWGPVEVYIDNDFSAFSGVVRPAYRRMLEDLQLGRLAAVVTWDADRLHRSTRELEDFIDLVETTRTPVVTVTAGEIDVGTATGRLQARIQGTISRYESEHKTERITTAMASLAEAGRWKGGPRPYGYDVDRDNHGRPLRDGRLIVVPAEAAIVREAATRMLAGETVYRVCKDLNARGVPTAQGRRWRTQTLRRILTNPATAGKREYRGTVVADALWPPLLPEHEWHDLRARLLPEATGRPPAHSGGGVRTYLLTGGIAICGICGSHLHAHKKGAGLRAYNCMTGPDKEGCGGVTCSAKPLDRHVVNAVLTRCEQEDPTPPAGSMQGPAAGATTEGIAELARLFVTGSLGQAAWRIAQAGIATLKSEPQARPVSQAPSLHSAVHEQWDALPLEQQRQRITDVLEHVVVNRATRRGPQFDHGRVVLHWR